MTVMMRQENPTTRSFLFGELDAETGFSHLWHAACCITFLLAYEERGIGEDDRAQRAVTERQTTP